MSVQVRLQTGRYCLFCFAPMPAERRRVSVTCDACGEVNVVADRRTRWTRARTWIAAEVVAQVIAGTISILALGFLLFLPGGGVGMGQGYAIGGWIFLAGFLWESASAITHRSATLPLRMLWGGAGLIAGVVVLLVALFGVERGALQALLAVAVAPLCALGPPWVAFKHRASLRRSIRTRGSEVNGEPRGGDR